MKMHKEAIQLKSYGGRPSYIDITEKVKEAVNRSEINEGILVVTTPHTTCAVFFEEFTHDINEVGDDFLQEDLNRILENIIPKHENAKTYRYPGEKHYEAVEKWPNVAEYLPNGDRSALWNADAHLKATLIGGSESFNVTDGKLGVGSTGYIYFADFDITRERSRSCVVSVIGE